MLVLECEMHVESGVLYRDERDSTSEVAKVLRAQETRLNERVDDSERGS